jgi:hypothetical protein
MDKKGFVRLTLGACIIKLITAVINSVTWKASVFVKASKKRLTIANTLTYFTTVLITAVKSFMMHASGGQCDKLFTAVID